MPKYPKQPAVSYALDPTSRGAYAPYTPVELLVRCVEKIGLSAVHCQGIRKAYPAGHPSQLRCQPATYGQGWWGGWKE